jgi:hypothetical protein
MPNGDLTSRPTLGSVTGNQTPGGDSGRGVIGAGGSYDGMIADLTCILNVMGQAMQGELEPPKASYATYRRMRSCPTLALARAVQAMPILSADTTIECDGGDPRQEALAESLRKRLWPAFVREGLSAIEYGSKGFEEAWAYRDGVLQPDDIKPLLVDKTRPLVDESGRLSGLENFGIPVGLDNCVWLSHDGEDRDPRGRSRYENVRASSWWEWVVALRQYVRYLGRTANPPLQFGFPPGDTLMDNNAKLPAILVAHAIEAAYYGGRSIFVPHNLMKGSEDLLRAGAKMEDLKAWSVSAMELKLLHGQEFIDAMHHGESGIMRGMFIPERAALEGSHGTKAEAEVHTDMALKVSDVTLGECLEVFNKQVVDRTMVYNFGPQAADVYRVTAAKLSDDDLAFEREVIKQAFVANPSLLEQYGDIPKSMQRMGMSMRDQNALAVPTPTPTPVVDPNKPRGAAELLKGFEGAYSGT